MYNFIYISFLDYVSDIYQDILTLLWSQSLLQKAVADLKTLTPPFMNTMLDKKAKDVAVARKLAQQSFVTVDVPPSTTSMEKNYVVKDFLLIFYF